MYTRKKPFLNGHVCLQKLFLKSIVVVINRSSDRGTRGNSGAIPFPSSSGARRNALNDDSNARNRRSKSSVLASLDSFDKEYIGEAPTTSSTTAARGSDFLDRKSSLGSERPFSVDSKLSRPVTAAPSRGNVNLDFLRDESKR